MKMEYGYLTPELEKMGKMGKNSHKPVLEIKASVDSMQYDRDYDYRMKEVSKLRKDLKIMNDEVANWDSEAVSAKALKSLKTEIAIKKARLMEYEAMLGEKGEGEEGAEDDEDEGSVVGGPYEIRKKGNKYQVDNMETGHVKGTHNTRKKALKQFRLLEKVAHNKSKG